MMEHSVTYILNSLDTGELRAFSVSILLVFARNVAGR